VRHLCSKGWYGACVSRRLLSSAAGQVAFAENVITVRHLIDDLDYGYGDTSVKFLTVSFDGRSQ
jgi:hypothetical protein